MKKQKHDDIPPASPVSQDDLAAAFPAGFGTRDEANALVAYAFRNGPLENLHAGKASPLTSDPELSRITDSEMKELMINASEHLAKALALRESDPEAYQRFVQAYGMKYCRLWNR